MRKLVKMTTGLTIMLLVLFSISINSFAISDYGIDVKIQTDKTLYSAEETAKVNVVIDNTNNFSISNVTIENIIPEGLIQLGKEDLKVNRTLNAGEKVYLSFALINETVVDANKNIPHTGNTNTAIGVAFILLIVAASVFLLVKYRENGTKVVSIILSIAILIPIASNINVLAVDGDIKTFETVYTIKMGEKEYEYKTVVSYPIDKGAPVIDIDEKDMTYSDEIKGYFLQNAISSLEGTVATQATVTELRYSILDSKNNVLKSGELTPGLTFKIDDIGFLVGVNILKVEAKDDKNRVGIEQITVFNTNQENMTALNIDTKDDDKDGLINYLETFYETDKDKPDTDSDGVTDFQEVSILNTDPVKADTDNNGINDGDEDFDKDSIINKEEFSLNGNPLSEDTDFDGLKDGQEKTLGTKLEVVDSDEDGLRDFKETELGTNPLNPDTNGNGILDGDEVFATTLSPKANDVDTKAIPTIEMDLQGKQLETLNVSKISEDDVFLSNEIPGFIGCGYEFDVEGPFTTAKLSFAFDNSKVESNTYQPRIYYFNEKEQTLEELPNQVVTGNTVSTKVTHFSKYILLNKVDFDKVWETEIKAPTSGGGTAKPMDLSLVIDGSGSMTSSDPANIRFDASKQIIDKIGSNDRVAVIGFDNYASLCSAFTSDKDVAKNAVPNTFTDGGTSIYNGIIMALDQFDSQSRESIKNMIVLTDGEDNYSYDYTSLLQRAKQNNVIIYTIGLGDPYYDIDVTLLTKIATATGGKYYHATTAGDLLDQFGQAQEDIANSKDTDGDGLSDYIEQKIISGELVDTMGKKLSVNDSKKLSWNDANIKDSDGDTLSDGEEIKINLTADGKYVKSFYMYSDPTMKDSDFDGYDDKKEKNNGTKPLTWDVSDRDLAILAQAAYSYDLVSNTTILNNLDAAALNRVDKGFLETASVKEMKGWKVELYYRQTKQEKEDKKHGGFSYCIFSKDDNIVFAYRGSVGEMSIKCDENCKGDWHNNLHVYWNANDKGGVDAENTIKEKLSMYSGKKIYITGHSRGGFLAQRAMAEVGKKDWDSKITKLAYFNGMGVVFTKIGGGAKIFNNLEKVKSKVAFYRIKGVPKGDVVSMLGCHVVNPKEYDITDVAQKNLSDFIDAPHSMSNFTYYLMPERKDAI